MNKKILLILIAVLSTSACTAFVFFNFPQLFGYEIIELKMHLKVSNYTGFNIDTDAIYFGTISPSGTGRRDVIISNNYAVSKYILIRGNGDLAKWSYISDNNFIIAPYENKTVKVNVGVPSDAEYGNYTGTLEVILR